MRFEVSPAVFELLPDACFGVVAVKGADNSKPIPEVSALLHESIAAKRLSRASRSRSRPRSCPTATPSAR